MNRGQVRHYRQQVVYESSEDDEYETDPVSGAKRQRVGYLFKTAPRLVLSQFLTEDDQHKLDRCTSAAECSGLRGLPVW